MFPNFSLILFQHCKPIVALLKPKRKCLMLSLYEPYLLAKLYKPGTPDCGRVMEIVDELSPNTKLSRITMAMFRFSENKLSRAIEFMQGFENDPEAWLFLSSFHARNKEFDKATEYALRAKDIGNSNAENQMRRIEEYRHSGAEF